MVITKISKAIKTEGRYNIFVDEKYSFSLDELQLASLGLHKGQEITEDDIEKLKVESNFGKGYVRALDLISRRQRSEKEIRDYAWRKQWSAEVRDRIVERLKDRHYIDDNRFAEDFVRDRAVLRNFSKRRMVQELVKKGIDKVIIERAVNDKNNFDELESLRNLVVKKYGKYTSVDKFIKYLMRQGFYYNDIKSTIDELL